jgi:hypothetical protein
MGNVLSPVDVVATGGIDWAWIQAPTKNAILLQFSEECTEIPFRSDCQVRSDDSSCNNSHAKRAKKNEFYLE